MAFVLPTWPGPSRMTPRPISARGEARPGTNAGPVTRLPRPGTRWAWDITMPPMTYVESLAWDDLLTEHETVVMDILQPGLVIGEPGSPRINGANQSGMMLNLDGLAAGYVVRKGQWLSFDVVGQIYAYKAAATVAASGAGALALPLRTMLRLPPADNAVVNIAAPQAEGFATVEPSSMEVDTDGLVRLRFTLEERD